MSTIALGVARGTVILRGLRGADELALDGINTRAGVRLLEERLARRGTRDGCWTFDRGRTLLEIEWIVANGGRFAALHRFPLRFEVLEGVVDLAHGSFLGSAFPIAERRAYRGGVVTSFCSTDGR